nr:hypothetical protein [uncultured Glaciecola sp.]
MKKLSTVASMKTLLLTTSMVAISSSAFATNTSPLLDSAVTDTLTVTAKYVTPIAVGLDTTSIDFGDVWSDSVISTEAVVATITGEVGETFTYSVTGDSMLKLTGDIEGTTIAFSDITTKALTFNVGLDVSGAATGTTISETITISVNYDAIADTTVTSTPAPTPT